MPESMLALLAAVVAVAAVIAAVLSAVTLARVRANLTKEVLSELLRFETETIRRAGEDQARGLAEAMLNTSKAFNELLTSEVRTFGDRVEAGATKIDQRMQAAADKLDADLEKMTEDAHKSRDGLRQVIEAKLEASVSQQSDAAKDLREELNASFHRFRQSVAETLEQTSAHQKEKLEQTSQAIVALRDKHEAEQEKLRQIVEARLDAIRLESAAKLDEIRQTVDEKLQSTLETRLGESFSRVVEHLERVREGIGEMKSLAANVGDLKNVLTNVKVRGTYGEVQLALLLEQFLSPEQYVTNAAVRPNSAERVEFAIKFPGADEPVLLPVDSKFPREDYDHLQEALNAGDTKLVAHFRRELENNIKRCAREIRDKYIAPPHTLEFAVLFLPTESLYAEVIRQPGLFEAIQRDYRVILAGPTNFAALLTSFQMGFRSLALQERSSEVWDVLGAVKREFEKYNGVVTTLSNQLNTAIKSVDKLGTRTRAMARTLKAVETRPDGGGAEKLLGLTSDDLPIEVEEAEDSLNDIVRSGIVVD